MKRIFALLVAALLALPFGSAGAAVSSTASSIQYAGNGSTTAFSFPYPYFQSSDLTVTLFNNGVAVTPAPQLNGSGTFDYTVTGVSAFSASANNVVEFASATVTFNTAPPGADLVVIQRSLAATQALNLLDNAKFPASSVNAAFDREIMVTQQLAAAQAASVQAPSSDPAGLSYLLPPVATRASQYACFDASGNVSSCAPSSGVIVSSAMAPVVAASTLTIARNTLIPGLAQGDLLYDNGTDLVRLPAGTLGQRLQTNGASANPSWVTGDLTRPQGRLTLTSGAPVMSADATAQGTVLYTPYQGALCPVYGGASAGWSTLSFSETALVLDATGHVINKNYDIFAWNNGGTFAIGTGPAWTSDTVRGTGAGTTELQMQNGIWTNKNAIVLRNNSVNTSSIPANQATYLGTLRTTAAGQTGMQFKPAAAAGGSNNVLGLYNAYNRVQTRSIERDSTASWTYSSASWRATDNVTTNRISFIDGLAQSHIRAHHQVVGGPNGASAVSLQTGVNLDSAAATPNVISQFGMGSGAGTSVGNETFAPQIGWHFVQEMEFGDANVVLFDGAGKQALVIELEM